MAVPNGGLGTTGLHLAKPTRPALRVISGAINTEDTQGLEGVSTRSRNKKAVAIPAVGAKTKAGGSSLFITSLTPHAARSTVTKHTSLLHGIAQNPTSVPNSYAQLPISNSKFHAQLITPSFIQCAA